MRRDDHAATRRNSPSPSTTRHRTRARVRNLQIARGTSDLHFMDIAATVNPATVHFRSISEPSRVGMLEQITMRPA